MGYDVAKVTTVHNPIRMTAGLVTSIFGVQESVRIRPNPTPDRIRPTPESISVGSKCPYRVYNNNSERVHTLNPNFFSNTLTAHGTDPEFFSTALPCYPNWSAPGTTQ